MGFFYPRLDFAQNVREGMPAVRLLGPPEPGRFLWCFEDAWRVAQSFESGSNLLVTRLAHVDAPLHIEIADLVPPGERALVRRIVITRSPEVGPVQFMHYFRLVVGDSETRNGAYAYPDRNLIVQHYRDIALAVTASQPFAAQCSSQNHGEPSPTKAAMERGEFHAWNQAIGRVDFAVGFEPVHEQTWETRMVLAGGPDFDKATESARRLADVAWEDLVRSANRRAADLIADVGVQPLPELADAFDRAVISLHDLYDETSGSFIAAPEFDPGYELSGGYGYCWPRDAAVCALAMQLIGHPDKARRFFDWSARTQLPSGHWFQRYWLDGTPAPAWCVRHDEIQLDQTCAILHAAGTFARRLEKDDDAFVRSYMPTAEAATRAILDYIGDDHLHRKATDLWENSVGAFAYTQAGVVAALQEADEVFGIERERTGPAVREQLRAKLIETFWQSDRQRWLRRITPEGEPDGTLDSSAMGIIDPWNLLDLQDPGQRALAVATLDGISLDLRSDVKAGAAILRFQAESYMGGGPGCVNTLWLALCQLRLAGTATEDAERTRLQKEALENIRIALANTSPTGQLPELIPKMSFDYWAAPHAWACSLLIEAALAFPTLADRTPTVFDSVRARVRRRAPS